MIMLEKRLSSGGKKKHDYADQYVDDDSKDNYDGSNVCIANTRRYKSPVENGDRFETDSLGRYHLLLQ